MPAIVTNIAYQGIIVTPGRHRVEMEYRNELVRVGMLISLLTGAVLIGILVVYRPPRVAAPKSPAYEEPVHVVADASGIHVEPAATGTTDRAAAPGDDGLVS